MTLSDEATKEGNPTTTIGAKFGLVGTAISGICLLALSFFILSSGIKRPSSQVAVAPDNDGLMSR